MSKLSTFFYVLKRSFTSPSYYGDILKAPFSFSLKFFLVFFFFYSIIGTIVFAATGVRPIEQFLTALPSRLEKAYPTGLEITVTKGTVTTNAKEPFFIPLRDIENAFKEDNVLGARNKSLTNVLVIDTQATIEDFDRYDTASLITKDNFVVMKDNGGYEVYPLREWPDMTINRAQMVELIGTIKPFFKWVVPAVVLLVFVGLFVFFPSAVMMSLFFYALAVWIVGKILSFSLTYKKSYQMAMHVALIPITFTSLLELVNVNITVQYFNTIVISLIAGYIMSQLKKVPSTPPVPHHTHTKA